MNSEKINNLIDEGEFKLKDYFEYIDKTAFKNQKKVMDAFSGRRVSDACFNNSSGYGYNDRGRDVLDLVWADVFESEAAFVRPHIVSGTHAITIGLFGLLRPGDIMLSVTGAPYDTLLGPIGIRPGIENRENTGSLIDFGVKYMQTEIINNQDCPFDFEAISKILRGGEGKSVKVIFVQKSKGYKDRITVKSEGIGELVKFVKSIDSDIYIVVDNCYGEFVEEHEPCYYGADLAIGSLIKNPGGGIAQCGGYIAGTKKAVEMASYRLTAPLLGTHVGASLGQTYDIYKGLFFAPHTVAQSLKTISLAAYIYEKLGYEVRPGYNCRRYDIIQTIKFQDEDKLINFIGGIQAGSAVDSHVVPEPSEMPGYNCKVIMASGSFVQGSSIEISADAPVKPPYTAFMQGGLTYESGKLCLIKALEREI
ncbi:MAG: methionine gamma-lyase family protein [Oscillospiraceae bacterium]|nr:methionine gamma-lyase family protein [Oscillospiraceae bacterium]